MIAITATPLQDETWVYPCTCDEIARALTHFSADDLAGIHAVRLRPATRKYMSANASYSWDRSQIYIYSHLGNLEYKQPAGTKRHQLEAFRRVERLYGLQLLQREVRWITKWNALDDLRRFILEHVLAHEVGHHVYHRQRHAAGYEHRPHTRESEQFAEAYADRHRAKLRVMATDSTGLRVPGAEQHSTSVAR